MPCRYLGVAGVIANCSYVWMSQEKNKRTIECCCICIQFEASVSQLKVTRSTKQDSWILCDCCKNWFHTSCGGFTSSQYSKICRDSLWIKCAVCCFQQILLTESDECSCSTTSLILEAAKTRISQAHPSKVSKRRESKESKSQSSASKPRSGNDRSCLSLKAEVISVPNTAADKSTVNDSQLTDSTPYSSARPKVYSVQSINQNEFI